MLSGDTHALAETAGAEIAAAGGANNWTEAGSASGNIAAAETDLVTLAPVTPGAADNKVAAVGHVRFQKQTAQGDATLRFKEGAITLSSETVTAVPINGFNGIFFLDYIDDVTVAAHTYKISLQFSNDGGIWYVAHAAALPSHLFGVSGTCQ